MECEEEVKEAQSLASLLCNNNKITNASRITIYDLRFTHQQSL